MERKKPGLRRVHLGGTVKNAVSGRQRDPMKECELCDAWTAEQRQREKEAEYERINDELDQYDIKYRF